MSWIDALNVARLTVGKMQFDKEPSDSWKLKMLYAEHSPIRLVRIAVTLRIKSWVSAHFIRHKIGVEHFVTSQRDDRKGEGRKGEERDSKRQDELVEHTMVLNAQSAINISRKRLCNKSHSETREAWLNAINSFPIELAMVCVPECVYRGFCPEMHTCGFENSKGYEFARDRYILKYKGIKNED